ncbi:MAG: STAS domain-containing protein, partial [Wenzhouxiangella sp.]
MVIAVAVGIGLAAMLFIQRMANLTSTEAVRGSAAGLPRDLPPEIAAFRIRGPMFFGAAERALATLHRLEPEVHTVILDMRDVPSMDMSAIVVFQSMVRQLQKKSIALIVTHAEARIIAKLRRAGIRRVSGQLTFCRSTEQALRVIRDWASESERNHQGPVDRGIP